MKMNRKKLWMFCSQPKLTLKGSHTSGNYEACSGSTQIYLRPPSTTWMMAEGERLGDTTNL